MALGHLPPGPYLANGRPNTIRSDPRNVEHLAEPLRSRVRQLIADCPHTLYLVSGLRDPGRQWDLRRDRVGIANVWRYPPRGTPTTAVPARWDYAAKRWVGGSRHQTGDAADLGGSEAGMAWMHANRERYGLAKTVPNERWHLEADRVDIYTRRRHDNPTALRPTPPPPPPIPKDWFDMATEDDLRRVVRDEMDDNLRRYQPYTVKATGQSKGRVVNGSVWIVYPLTGEAWRPTNKADIANWRATLDTLTFFGAVRPDEVPIEAAQIARLYRLVG